MIKVEKIIPITIKKQRGKSPIANCTKTGASTLASTDTPLKHAASSQASFKPSSLVPYCQHFLTCFLLQGKNDLWNFYDITSTEGSPTLLVPLYIIFIILRVMMLHTIRS